MGDNPYKYYNLQWEIIHTLLSCDNIFFVHVLYVFSLVLFCLLMIVQCLDFKSIKLLLLLLSLLLLLLFLPKCLKIAETIVVLIVFNGVICEVSAYTVTVSVALQVPEMLYYVHDVSAYNPVTVSFCRST